MLFSSKSGKAKHRRPSKAVRYATLAGITGAAVAAPLIGATSASAATTSEWDTVAQCESGGNWSINTGNGYYGGLQFSASTWAAFGGSAFASTADQASKSQQIQIAEKVLAGQGKGAWPSCGVGLSNAANDAGSDDSAQQQAPQQQAPAPKAAPRRPRSRSPRRAPSGSSPLRAVRRVVRSRRATASTRSRAATRSPRSPRPRRSKAAGRSSSS